MSSYLAQPNPPKSNEATDERFVSADGKTTMQLERGNWVLRVNGSFVDFSHHRNDVASRNDLFLNGHAPL